MKIIFVRLFNGYRLDFETVPMVGYIFCFSFYECMFLYKTKKRKPFAKECLQETIRSPVGYCLPKDV